jgi:uncharacterized membrane-anchored protein
MDHQLAYRMGLVTVCFAALVVVFMLYIMYKVYRHEKDRPGQFKRDRNYKGNGKRGGWSP